MAGTATRERILESALTLFAEKGYDGVGVDLIAEKAGVKGPSIYKHFKGKEEILNVLVEQVEAYYETHFGSESHIGKVPASVEELVEQSMRRIQFTLQNDTMQKTRRILTMEQFRNERIAKLSTLHNLDGIHRMYTKIFEKMMEQGTIKKTDSKYLALAFVSPVALLIQTCDREPDRQKDAMKDMRAYMIYILKDYKV